MDRLAGAAAGQVIRADAFVDAAPGTRGTRDHGDGDAAPRWIARRRRRDRVIARRQQRQHFKISVERQFAGRMFFQQVKHRFALAENFRTIKLGGGGIVAEIGHEFRFGYRTTGVLRHDLDLFAGRDLLQLHKLTQQPPHRNRIADRQLRAAAFGDLQPDLVGRQESEAARHRIHQRRIVARHYAEVIADPVAGAGRQLHLDVPGRPLRGIGAALVLQFAVGQHLHRRSAAEGNDRIDGGRRNRLDLVQRLVVGIAHETRSDAELLYRDGLSFANQPSNWPSRSSRASPSPRR